MVNQNISDVQQKSELFCAVAKLIKNHLNSHVLRCFCDLQKTEIYAYVSEKGNLVTVIVCVCVYICSVAGDKWGRKKGQ